jgi:hypothetical protein
MSQIPWDAGLSPDVILGVEAAAGAYLGLSLAQEEAATPPTGTITAAVIEAVAAQAASVQFPAQQAGANIPLTPLTQAPPLLLVWAFMGAERTQESGSFAGNYQVINSIGCRGAYQFCPGTDMYAKAEAAGWTKEAQDQIAAAQMGAYFDKFGSWQAVAEAWYGGPGNVGLLGDTQDHPTVLQYSIDVIDTANALLASQGNYVPFPYPLGGGPGGVELLPNPPALAPAPPTVSLPGGTPNPPPSIESFIDGLINDIPSVPLISGPLKSALRFILDPVASGIDAVLDWSVNVFNDVWGDVTAGFGQIESGVEDALNAAKSFASTVGQEVLHDAESLYNQAVSTVEDWADGALHLIEAGVDEALSLAHDAESGLTAAASDAAHEAASLIDAGVHDAEGFATQAVADLKQWTADGLHDAVAGIDAAERAAESFATAAVDDVRQWATDALNAVGDFAANALGAVERDVIAPIFSEVEHIAQDILPGVETVVADVGKVADWLVWLAEFPFKAADEVVAAISSGNPRQWAAQAVKLAADDGGASFRRWAGVFN